MKTQQEIDAITAAVNATIVSSPTVLMEIAEDPKFQQLCINTSAAVLAQDIEKVVETAAAVYEYLRPYLPEVALMPTDEYKEITRYTVTKELAAMAA